jgi:uncharacterized Zn finger protein (UPF0148 family)
MLERTNVKLEKIKCPMCGKKFVPKFFHREKVNYELEVPIHRFKIHKFKNSNGEIRPYNILRRSWVTYCPKCRYIIKFAAEIGKKEMLSDYTTFFHFKEFKENDHIYEYNFHNLDKPYKEAIHYNKEILENLKKEILKILEDSNLLEWGKLYHMWYRESSIDSFKYLIRFYSQILKYIEIKDSRIGDEEFLEKIEVLELSEDLKEALIGIKELRRKTIYEYHDLNKSDEDFIRGVYMKLIFDLIFKKLAPLGLNNIYKKKNGDVINKEYLYSELKNVLSNILEDLSI